MSTAGSDAGEPTPEPWATVRVYLGDDLSDDDEPDDATIEALETLGALVAGEDVVGGVERRDLGTLVGANYPELWVYTTPPGIEVVQARVAALAPSLGLTVQTAVEVHHDDDWRESWKRFYPPMILGDGALLVRPSWVPRHPTDPERELVIDPGRAFGTGLHESTRLCLDRLCGLFSEGLRPAAVLDLGCGSGILALAAARLFPAAVLQAVDFDPEAIETTDENVAANELGARITTFVGTIDDVDDTARDLLIANIRPEVLIPAAAKLRDRVAPGGRVLLSGILVEEASAVEAAYTAVGLELVRGPAMVRGDWQAVELRRP